MLTHADHLVNFESIKMARAARGAVKSAFVPGADPSMGGGAGGGPPGGAPPPGGDPSGGGGGAMPPPDPSMLGGAAAPPPDPAAGGGGGGLDAVLQKLNQMSTQLQGGGAGGAGGAAGGGTLKPKVDQNVISVQILKALARICDHLGIQVPMSDMVPAMGDLNQLASASQGQAPMPGAAGGGAGGGQQAVPPVDPMQGMQPAGVPGAGGGEKAGGYAPLRGDGFVAVGRRAAAIRDVRRRRGT